MFLLGATLGWIAVSAVAGWLLPKRWQLGGIAASGAGFLATVSPPSLAVLLAATLVTFAVARRAARHPALVLGTIVAIAAAYLAALAAVGTSTGMAAHAWVLPIGLSYYVLRLVHYLIESERGTIRPHTLTEYLAYHFLPSALPVGPIHRIEPTLRDLRRRRWDAALFSDGLGRILIGVAKIVLVGGSLLPAAMTRLGVGPGTDPGAGYLAIVNFWLNLYVNFSGYADIAIGGAALIGVRLPENFDFPFLARNIAIFWRRWHMTLSGWCRDYVYMPVLARWRTPALAFAASMTVLGLWHELSVHYLLWGLYHAAGLSLWRRFDLVAGPAIARWPARAQRAWAVLATVATLHFVIFSYPVTNAIEGMMSR